MKNSIFFLVILQTCLFCCKDDSHSSREVEEQVILQTLDSALLDATLGDLDSVIIQHFNFFPDKLRTISSDILNKTIDTIGMEKQDSIISKRLVEKISDTIVHFSFKRPYFFETNKIVERKKEIKLTKHKNYFGTICLSDPVLNKDKNLACYYYSLNCWPVELSGCTFSSIVFCEKKNQLWEVRRILYPVAY